LSIALSHDVLIPSFALRVANFKIDLHELESRRRLRYELSAVSVTNTTVSFAELAVGKRSYAKAFTLVDIGVTAVAMHIVARALSVAASVIGLLGQNVSKRFGDFCFSR
jgi:hypothetical protein